MELVFPIHGIVVTNYESSLYLVSVKALAFTEHGLETIH